MNKMIYADNAATTKLHPQALEAMMPYLTEEYGNPSSLYSFGQNSRRAVEKARCQIAECLDCLPKEVFFTSGGSEADNWAIKMAAEQGAAKGKKHIISTAFEHHAILHTLNALQKKGFEVTLLPVYDNGIVRVEDVKAVRQQRDRHHPTGGGNRRCLPRGWRAVPCGRGTGCWPYSGILQRDSSGHAVAVRS